MRARRCTSRPPSSSRTRCPRHEQLDPDVHDRVLEEGLRLAAARNVTGKDVTPFLLDHFHRATHGASLVVNEQIIVRNAELAARIAVAHATARRVAAPHGRSMHRDR